ncbi:MAG: transcription antitermination factor NusB [Dongiaceae bacterium]
MNKVSSSLPVARRQARLAAVQALYQAAFNTDTANVVQEFSKHRLGKKFENLSLEEADIELFTDLYRGVERERAELDRLIAANLADNWKIERIDPVARAILLSAIYELWCRADIPPKVTIKEYVDLAHDFFGGKEPDFINGILDKLAHHLRPQEMAKS